MRFSPSRAALAQLQSSLMGGVGNIPHIKIPGCAFLNVQLKDPRAQCVRRSM